ADGPAGGGAGRTAATRPAAGGSRHGGGIGRARIKEAPFGAAPAAMETVAAGQEAAATAPPNAAPQEPRDQGGGGPPASRPAPAGVPGVADTASRSAQAAQADQSARAGTADATHPARGGQAALPFAAPHPQGQPPTADGRQNCGPLESILWRQWDAAETTPPP